MESKEVTPKRVQTVARDSENMGHSKIILKSGNEPSMKPPTSRPKDMRSHPRIVEESPEYGPQADGMVERCVPSRGVSRRRGAHWKIG